MQILIWIDLAIGCHERSKIECQTLCRIIARRQHHSKHELLHCKHIISQQVSTCATKLTRAKWNLYHFAVAYVCTHAFVLLEQLKHNKGCHYLSKGGNLASFRLSLSKK